MVGEHVGEQSEAAAAFAGRRQGARREFRDAAGREWVAYERPILAAEWTTADIQSDLAGYGVGWLCFESAERRLRLRLYPKQWHRLSDAELERLCRRARRDPKPPK
jgi:hypothetical protein